MAYYTRFGAADNLFRAYSGKPLKETLVSQSATQIVVENSNGSLTTFQGSGFAWNAATGKFTAGTVTGINHETGGLFTDKIEGLSLGIAAVQAAFEANDTAPLGIHALVFAGNDTLNASTRANGAVIHTSLWSMAGNDRVLGGLGNDFIAGGADNDTIVGGAGNDDLYGENGNDVINGGAGNDRIQAGFGDDRLLGGAGKDTFHAGGGDDTLEGGTGSDVAVHHSDWAEMTVTRKGGTVTVSSYSGVDTLVGVELIATDTGVYRWRSATDSWIKISTNPGEAILHPESRMKGTNGNNNIDMAGTGKTVVQALNGHDTVHGTGGFELILGGGGRDVLYGDIDDAGKETTSIDRLYGESGNDTLWGLGGDDRLYGGAGGDNLYGGSGFDVLSGGQGADVFHFKWATFRNTDETWGRDVVTDFKVGEDHLNLIWGRFDRPVDPEDKIPELIRTADGLLLTHPEAGSILLEGVKGAGITLDDLLV